MTVRSGNSGIYNGEGSIVYYYLVLYKLYHKNKYIEYAEELGEDLTRSALIMAAGIGWTPEKGTIPLLGMTHGNAGVLVAVVTLYQITNKMKYLECIEKTLIYEYYNFDPIMKDWEDFREKEQEHKGDNQPA